MTVRATVHVLEVERRVADCGKSVSALGLRALGVALDCQFGVFEDGGVRLVTFVADGELLSFDKLVVLSA